MPIVRSWVARASADGARAYVRYFGDTLLPALRRIDGFRGALVATGASGGSVEIRVQTFWASMDAVRGFASDPERAVLEPEAIPLLEGYDHHVAHHEIELDARA